ncbi:MAG: hypothetical protein OXU42_04115 [Deltaproteobacteria bacterium]|nr:hypothetical protein [Deltaproteobacteria bacterium]
MLTNVDDLLVTARKVFSSSDVPKPFALLQAAGRVRRGETPAAIAREIRSTRAKVQEVADATDPIRAVFGVSLTDASTDDALAKTRRGVGQMLVGTLAERSFEATYRSIVQTDELRLEDDRAGRTDTDYRVYNGQDRPVFRINIKFHGSAFRKAVELVGLESADCFPLATYKIYSARKKQEQEYLPYLFVIVSIPGLTGDSAGAAVPEDVTHLTALYMKSSQPRKQNFEDHIVHHLVDAPQVRTVAEAIKRISVQIDSAPWRVISARRADRLLHELLFDRVYAVRVRGFASNYSRAEVDMHFSISKDLTALEEMLVLLRDHGLQGLTTRIERGDL